jgi:hypothetical protein
MDKSKFYLTKFSPEVIRKAFKEFEKYSPDIRLKMKDTDIQMV